ncbi:MAG: GNAT family N-acetyltransferase [Clostridiales bacterium]|nr:GNAT family N-acetyltransferase [Clostridiales bacterium]
MTYRMPEAGGGDREMLCEYVREHRENGETDISASHGLTGSEYSEWVGKSERYIKTLRKATRHGENRYLYLCLEGGRLIGLLSIRYGLPEELSRKYGHIGFGVRPSERKKGYAAAMLEYALSVCKDKGMNRVILGCYKDNPASAAVIIKNGGVLISETGDYTEGRISRYYSIELQAADGEPQ